MRRRLIPLMAVFGVASAGTAYGLVNATLHPPPPVKRLCLCAKASLPQPTPEALIDRAILKQDWVTASLPEITDDIALHLVGALMGGAQFWIVVPPGTKLPERLNFDHPGLRIREGSCAPYFVASGSYVLINGRVWRSADDSDRLSERVTMAYDRARLENTETVDCRTG